MTKITKKLFGTDGIRGTANIYPMTPEIVLNVGKAIAHIFKEKCKSHKPKIVIGKDTRLSGYMIENALTSGIVSVGVDVLLVGPLPTPAIAHLTKSLNADAGIVLSASHNPAEDNGIKIFDAEGFKLSDQVEMEIEKYVFTESVKTENIKGDLIGKAYRIDDAKGRYIEFAKASVQSMSLYGTKIVLDCANGAAYNTAPNIFRELGADVIVLNDTPDGLNINLNCGATHPENMIEHVKKNNADIGIALDGDADRLIVVDEKGEILDGDFILAYSALKMQKNNELKNNTLVVTGYSNLCVDEILKKNGIDVVRTANGDRYVIEKMKKEGYNLGGETSGHIIFLDHATTGDGIISALQFLKLLKQNNAKVSETKNIMQKYPQELLNIDVKEKKKFSDMPNVQNKINEINKTLKESGRTLIRYSGTQNLCRIMIEGKDKGQIKKMADELANLIKKEIGV